VGGNADPNPLADEFQMNFVALLCGAYLLGAFPTGILMGRLVKGVDVRHHGSGNVGATNVYRVVGKLPGLLVLVIDTAKGWFPAAVMASWVGADGFGLPMETIRISFGVAAVAGHIWNPFLQFKGGKGVATALGVLLGLDARVALATTAVWLLVALTTRYVSAASIAAALAAPFAMAFLGLPLFWIFGGIAVSLSIIARHRPNILRLLHGEEHRFGKK